MCIQKTMFSKRLNFFKVIVSFAVELTKPNINEDQTDSRALDFLIRYCEKVNFLIKLLLNIIKKLQYSDANASLLRISICIICRLINEATIVTSADDEQFTITSLTSKQYRDIFGVLKNRWFDQVYFV